MGFFFCLWYRLETQNKNKQRDIYNDTATNKQTNFEILRREKDIEVVKKNHKK